MRASLLSLALLTVGTAASAAPLPRGVVEMMTAATPDQIDTVADVARKTYPDSTDEVDALVETIAARRQTARKERLGQLAFHRGWSGEGSVGGYRSRGNSDESGLNIGIKLDRDGIRIRHHIDAAMELQSKEGERSLERYAAGYQLDLVFSPLRYGYAQFQWEQDRFAGLAERFTESLGTGWVVADSDDLRLALEAGPALRQTQFTDGTRENNFNAKFDLSLRWALSSRTRFTEEASAIVGFGNNTFLSNTAFTTRLIRDLSGRISFLWRHETEPLFGREETDTLTRASLVYAF